MVDTPSALTHLRAIRSLLDGERILKRLDSEAHAFLVGRAQRVADLVEAGQISSARAAAEAIHLRTAADLFAPLPDLPR